MPLLFDAMEDLGWPEAEAWDKTAPHLAQFQDIATFTHEFCSWSHVVRNLWDSIVFEGADSTKEWPTLKTPAPPELIGRRWDVVRAYANKAPTLNELAQWHYEEFKSRGRGESDLWVSSNGTSTSLHPYNGSPSESSQGDCRWWNALAMMKRGQ